MPEINEIAGLFLMMVIIAGAAAVLVWTWRERKKLQPKKPPEQEHKEQPQPKMSGSPHNKYEDDLHRYSKEADAEDVLRKEQDILKKSAKGALAALFDDIKLLFAILKDYKNGNYTDIPLTTVALIAGALLYVFSPVDAVPDFIPVLGLVDDAGIVGILLSSIHFDLQRYKDWRNMQKDKPDIKKDTDVIDV